MTFSTWLASTALLLLCAATGAQAAAFPSYPFIHSTGSAERYLPPDIGEIEFDLVQRGTDAAAVLQAMQAKAEQVQAALRAQNVADDDVMSFDLQKSTQAKPGGEEAAQGGMVQLRRGFRVKVRDLQTWAAIIEPLLADSAVTQIDVQFSRLDRDKIRAELDIEAADDARAHGTRLAKAFGRKLDAPVAITTGDVKQLGAIFNVDHRVGYPAGVARPKPSAYVPSVIRFFQQFNVIFKLR
jgi:hypothetical protein